MKNTSFPAVFKAIIIISAVGAAIFGAIFIAAGWRSGAYRLFVNVAVTAGVNLTVYGLAAWFYALMNSRALGRSLVGDEEYTGFVVPAETAFILPVSLIVLFSAVWGIAVFGFGREFFDYFSENFPERIFDNASFLLFVLTVPAALISLIYILKLTGTRILYGDRSIEVKKPLRRPFKIYWQDISTVRFLYKKGRPERIILTCAGKKIKIGRNQSDMLKSWLPFGKFVIKSAKERNIKLEVTDVK